MSALGGARAGTPALRDHEAVRTSSVSRLYEAGGRNKDEGKNKNAPPRLDEQLGLVRDVLKPENARLNDELVAERDAVVTEGATAGLADCKVLSVVSRGFSFRVRSRKERGRQREGKRTHRCGSQGFPRLRACRRCRFGR